MSHLTTAQLQAIKAAIDADPTLSAQPMNLDGAFFIADELNKIASPDFYVWRTSVTQDEITQNGFTWTEVDGITAGKARIWEWLFLNESRAINPSKQNVRDGIREVWKGTAARGDVYAAVISHCYRTARRVEKILATGTGSTASPALMAFEGEIDPTHVVNARGS